MSFSPLPLSYCTNVHPARSLADVYAGLDRFTLPIREQFGQPLAAGLWLAKSVIDELQTPAQRQALARFLQDRELTCYTLNAFPYGDFHSERVKEQVYLPDWTSHARQTYTLDCARVLAAVLPPDTAGSISTVPLGFRSLSLADGFLPECIERLIATAQGLAEIRDQTGCTIRLAIEPEPLCRLETTPETIDFFRQLREAADRVGEYDNVCEFLGVCYDVCHQSVEFEDVAASIVSLSDAGIRINKVHLSCAIEVRNRLTDPLVAPALSRYVEPRYLHQTFAFDSAGRIASMLDLDATLITAPPAAMAAADTWRVHFHVPLNAERLGPLWTTRPDLERALPAVKALPYAPHLEVETYTWEVLPDGGTPQIIPGFAKELTTARELLSAVQNGE